MDCVVEGRGMFDFLRDSITAARDPGAWYNTAFERGADLWSLG